MQRKKLNNYSHSYSHMHHSVRLPAPRRGQGKEHGPRLGYVSPAPPGGQSYRYRDGAEVVAFKLRLCGLPIPKIAWVMGVSMNQLQYWRYHEPKFAEAWALGGEQADAHVAHALYARAVGYSHEAEKIFYNSKNDRVVRVPYVERFAPDTSAATAWLYNRQPQLWKNRSATQLTGPNDEPLAPPNISINVIAAAKS